MSRAYVGFRAPLESPEEPFASAQEAWFWYMACHEAKLDGARMMSGAGRSGRPCEPMDVQKAVYSLYRRRILVPEHVRVLVHYGRRLAAPDGRHPREGRDVRFWDEAMERLDDLLRVKGIVRARSPRARERVAAPEEGDTSPAARRAA